LDVKRREEEVSRTSALQTESGHGIDTGQGECTGEAGDDTRQDEHESLSHNQAENVDAPLPERAELRVPSS
jgi:hypothetical protein